MLLDEIISPIQVFRVSKDSNRGKNPCYHPYVLHIERVPVLRQKDRLKTDQNIVHSDIHNLFYDSPLLIVETVISAYCRLFIEIRRGLPQNCVIGCPTDCLYLIFRQRRMNLLYGIGRFAVNPHSSPLWTNYDYSISELNPFTS